MVYGNLTRDPELKALPSGNKVATFSLATNRVYKDQAGNRQESSEFHNIVVFGKQADLVAQYLKKGASAFIEGRLQTRSWETPQGEKKYRTEIVAERVQFGPRSAGSFSGSGADGVKEKNYSSPSNKDEGLETIDYGEESANPEDIPF